MKGIVEWELISGFTLGQNYAFRFIYLSYIMKASDIIMYGIYKITNKLNGKCYIGKSSDIEKRWKYHQTQYTYEKEWNKTLYKAFRKHGLHNFTFEVIESMSKDYYNKFSNNREEYWITYYDSFNNGYNETKGGDGGFIQKAVSKNRKLTEADVKNIRKLYASCNIGLSDAYTLYQNKISKRGFQAVWLGQNYKKIMPEVYTEENKRKHILLEHKRQGELRRQKK